MFFRRVRIFQLAILAAVCGVVSSPRASLLRAMGLVELANSADRIVVGKVQSVHAAWDLQHRKIISTIEVDIEDSWKGPQAGNRRITIVQPGGSVGDIEMTVQGMPSFVVGEKSLLFLQGQRQLHVVGMGQGKRALVWDDAGKQWLVQSPDTEGVVEVGPDARLRQAIRRAPISLNDLREQVRRVIESTP